MLSIRKSIYLIVGFLLVTITANATILGSETLYFSRIKVAEGTYYNNNVFFSDQAGVNQQTEYFFDYTPNKNVVPTIFSGKAIYGRRTISEIAEEVSNENPFMLMNADFFSFQTGIPMSHLVEDGEILSKSADNMPAIGFNDDGSAFISDLYINTRININEGEFPLHNINKYPQPGAFYLLSDRYADMTYLSDSATKIIIGELDNRLKVNETAKGVVEEIIHSNQSIPIPKDKLVLILVDKPNDTDNSEHQEILQNQLDLFAIGSEVSISSTIHDDPRWHKASYILGCIGGRLIQGGDICNIDDAAAPRSAIGIKADGSLIFYVIDGRQQGISYGVRRLTLAKRLQEMGCIDAVNLDGGGSTSLMARLPGTSEPNLINSPSEKILRPVTNFVGLVNLTKPTNILSGLYIYPYYEQYLLGAKKNFTVFGVDDNFYTTEIKEPLILSSPNNDIIIDGMTVTFLEPGETRIIASAGDVSTSAIYPVHRTPSGIQLLDESNGSLITSFDFKTDQVINFKARSLLNNAYLVSDDSCYRWDIEGNIGSINQEGIFTSSLKSASGRVIVQAGDKIEYFNTKVINDDIYETNSYTKAQFSLQDGLLMAELINTDRIPVNESNILVFLDGKEIDFSYDGKLISLTIPDNKMHKLLIKLTNSLEQPSIFTYIIDGRVEEDSFIDIDDHWAEKTIKYMNALDIIKGVEIEEGLYNFYPNSPMTRGEFALILSRYLKLEDKDYSHIELAYTDSEDIPSWGLNAVKAMGEKGLIKGKVLEGGENIFDFTNNITRVETIVILARLLPDELLKTDIIADDADDIPTWARDSFKIMLGQKFIAGYDDNTLGPHRKVSRAEALKLLFNIF